MENNLMAVKELERGREFANKLRGLLIFQHDDKAKVVDSAEDLVAKVLNSFTKTLSLFNHKNISENSSISFSSFSQYFLSNSDEFQSYDESPKSRRSPTSSTIKDPTTSSPNKRKRTVQTWVEDSKMIPKEDGHAWRKYGQKTILNTEHPRSYFRCTHKHDQRCEATKQVQKIQENPPIYRTTYFGHHTCTNLLNPHIFLDDSYDLLNPSSSYILSFDNNHTNNNNLITPFDPKVNKNYNNIFLSFGSSLFPSASLKNEEQCHNIKKHKKNNYINTNDKINDVVVPFSCSPNDDCHVSPHDQEAVLPPFGYGGDDPVDVFNSALFYDPFLYDDLIREIV